MTADDLQREILAMLGTVRGLGAVYVVSAGPHYPGKAFLVCSRWNGDYRTYFTTYVPLEPPSQELVATLQLYLAA